MNELNFHKKFSSAFSEPIVINKEKETYQYWLILHRNFPKIERLGIGQKINQLFLDILELSFSASRLAPAYKIINLEKIIFKIDVLKFFVQMTWEYKLIPTDRYSELSKKIEEIGRMFGGWKKATENKTSAMSAEEKQ